MTVLAQRNGVRAVAFNKCGCTSIISTFMSHENFHPIEVKEHDAFAPTVYSTDHQAQELGGYRGDLTNFHNWPKPKVIVAVLRNPVRRALSAYHHFLVRHERYKFKELGFEFGMSFHDFVTHLQTVDLTADRHIAPYTPDLLAAGDASIQYLIAPLELIQSCWSVMMESAGLTNVPATVRHRNNGFYDPDDYITVELHNVLRELYSQDYNLWESIYHEARTEVSPISNETH